MVKILATGEIIKADNDLDLVNRLRLNSMQVYDDVLSFMVDYARRAVIATGQDIRATSLDWFIEDLIKHKHIEYIVDKRMMN